ncbi:MAG: hypothetical protein L6Q60_07975 [Rhodocyclaceae bacterium]|nr:hypothetical protein [Rhodocyclaceae bacterium]
MSDALILFAEKAYKLENSPFWKWVSSRRGPSDIERIVAGDWLAHDGLSPEALDSFCLTLRLLIQDQDGFSIRKVFTIAEGWPEHYASRRNAIRLAIEKLHVELNKRSLIQFNEGRNTTNGDVFDIIFYGGIAHANPGKRDQFRRLTTAGLFSYFVFQAFSATLFDYRNCIQTVAFHIVQYLDEASCRAMQANPSAQ